MINITKSNKEAERQRIMVLVATQKGCPHCKSDNVQGWVHLINKNTVVCKCYSCGTEWEDESEKV